MRTPLAVCVLALVLSACGAAPRDSAQDFSGTERDVAATVEGLESAAREDNSDELCTQLLSDRLRAAVKEEGINCVTAAKRAFEDADSLDLTVDDVSVSGNTATANVTSRAGSNTKTDTLELEKVGAVWKILTLRP